MRPPTLAIPLRVVALLAGTLASLACISAPRADDWLALGFRSPRQTFATFQTGLRADEPDLEYRCFSQALKTREGFNQISYRELREELFSRQPWLKRVACAEIIGEEQLSPERQRLTARVSAFFVERTFTIDLVREDFYELFEGEERVDDDFADFEGSIAFDERRNRIRAEVPFVGLELDRLSEIRLGREWKLDGFPELIPSENDIAP